MKNTNGYNYNNQKCKTCKALRAGNNEYNMLDSNCFIKNNADCLRNLNSQLVKVADSLLTLHNEMEDTIRETAKAWQDNNFDQFAKEINPYQQDLSDLADKYKIMADKIHTLQDRIETPIAQAINKGSKKTMQCIF